MSRQGKVARPPGAEIVGALADADGVDTTELEYAIHEYVDPDALDQLLVESDADVTVRFDVSEHTVIVANDGSLTVDGTRYDWAR